MEGRPKPILQGLVTQKPTLEMILEVSSSTELGSEYQTPSIYPERRPSAQFTTNDKRDESLTKSPFGDDIPEVEEITAQEMWDAVRQNGGQSTILGLPSILFSGLCKKEVYCKTS